MMSYRVMEVCGTHTHAIMRYGLKYIYKEKMELISGPGCPVCVTTQSDIDRLLYLSQEGFRIYSFSDLLKVPGEKGTLRDIRARGGDVREIYNPLQILDDMDKDPAEFSVFAAIGFETTAPLVASLVEELINRKIKNVYLYSLLKLIPPAMDALLRDKESLIDGFLCPGHVSVVIGELPYIELSRKYENPFVIGGFDEMHLKLALDKLLTMLERREKGVVNAYSSVVKREGNPEAQKIIKKYFNENNTEWRGLGEIPNSGLKLKDEYSFYDIKSHYSFKNITSVDRCPCGSVITGKLQPNECSFFGKECTPESPVGPCMVSSEGACHAFFLYHQGRYKN
ncbi:MAG: hydrogenase formation protein HypD [Petrotogales bacterium]